MGLDVLCYTLIKPKPDQENQRSQFLFLVWKHATTSVERSSTFWASMNCKKVDEDHSQWDTLARVITHNTKGRFAPPARAKPTGKAGGRKAAKPKPKPVLGKDGLPLSKEKQELALLMKRCDDTIKAKLKKGRGIGYVALGEQRVFLMPVRYMPICEINEVNGTNTEAAWVSAPELLAAVKTSTPGSAIYIQPHMKEGDRDKTEAAKTRKGKTEARNTNGDGDAKQDASDETKHVNKNNSADTGSTCDTKFVDNDGKNSPTQGKSDQPAKDTENKDGDGEGDHHGILDDSGTTQNAGDDKTDNDDNNDRDDNEDTNDGGDSSGLPLSLPFATLMRDQQSYNEVMEVLSGFDKAFKDTVEEQITRLQSSSSTGAATTTASASAGSPSASRGGTDAASLASGMQALSVEKKKAPDAVYYSCKKCRKLVFSESDVTTHVPQGQCDDPNFNRIDFRGKQWHTTQKPAETKCSSYFLLDGPRFRSMASGSGADARETDVEKLARGDMQCPNPRCRARIGQFAWSGAQCSCGDWVVPALQVTKSKVDLKIRKQVPGISSSQIRRVTRERLNVRLQVIDKRDTPGQVQPVTAGSAASLPATV